MIVVTTPLRISFAGGGSDLTAFSRRRYGAVVSATIDLCITTLVQPAGAFPFNVSVTGGHERTDSVDHIREPRVRESLRLLGMSERLQIASVSAVPPGTGLGSSSAFTVSLLHALHALRGARPTAEQLAREACEIEIGRIGEPIGKQDQYAAAFGGLNYIRFDPDDTVSVTALACGPDTVRRLQERLLLFSIGRPRSAGRILRDQGEAMTDETRFRRVERTVRLAELFRETLEGGLMEDVGPLLHEIWMNKRQHVAGIASDEVDDCYERVRRAGASGGKLLGAGGGGFLLVFAEPERHPHVRAALSEFTSLSVGLVAQGSSMVAGAIDDPTPEVGQPAQT